MINDVVKLVDRAEKQGLHLESIKSGYRIWASDRSDYIIVHCNGAHRPSSRHTVMRVRKDLKRLGAIV